MSAAAPAAEQLDLLTALAEPATGEVVHALMPNMAMACGEDFLVAARASAPGVRPWVFHDQDGVTCTACTTAGDLPALARAMQRRQA